jgi:AraC-like DNA-binding protein
MIRQPLVSTMLTAPERSRVDAAGIGLYETLHRDSIDEVTRDVRHRGVGAILLSVNCCHTGTGVPVASRVASIVRDFPRVTAVALLTDADRHAPAALLSLGRSGIRTLIDARIPAGWSALRDVLSRRVDRASHVEGVAASRLGHDLRDAPLDCQRFFTALFTAPARFTTVRALSYALEVTPTTLVSRFARKGLPSPKAYLATARLTRAAAMLEDPAASIAMVAAHLEYSSSQSFGRHLQLRLQLTPSAFRKLFDGERMLERFRSTLVLGYLPALQTFSPLTPPVITPASANGVTARTDALAVARGRSAHGRSPVAGRRAPCPAGAL